MHQLPGHHRCFQSRYRTPTSRSFVTWPFRNRCQPAKCPMQKTSSSSGTAAVTVVTDDGDVDTAGTAAAAADDEEEDDEEEEVDAALVVAVVRCTCGYRTVNSCVIG